MLLNYQIQNIAYIQAIRWTQNMNIHPNVLSHITHIIIIFFIMVFYEKMLNVQFSVLCSYSGWICPPAYSSHHQWGIYLILSFHCQTTLVLSTNLVKTNGIHWGTALFCPPVGDSFNYELWSTPFAVLGRLREHFENPWFRHL